MPAAPPNSTAALAMVVMLISGACNTILMKFLVMQSASPGPGQPAKNFDYPFFQTMLMMIGELMCLAAAVATSDKTTSWAFPKWIMIIPVSCDWIATTLVNAAYVLIPASTIQMCRGCIVLFTCLFSVVFLGRRQTAAQFLGVGLVAAGISIVSLDAVFRGTSVSAQNAAWVGVFLCIAAQIFQSTMLVVEEKFLHQVQLAPLQMVGFEGLFGCFIGIAVLTSLQGLGIEMSSEALYMVHDSKMVQGACIVSMLSIAIFNWSGVTVTQQASAVSRSTIDVSRTVLVWIVELALLWNTFSWLQLVGFLVLTCGTLIYNGLVEMPFMASQEEKKLLTKAEVSA